MCRFILVIALLAMSPVAAAQEPAWTLDLLDAALPALGAYSHTVPDGEGGLYALAFASAEPYGIDARLDRYDADGALVWTTPISNEAGRNERPLAFAAASAGPCAALGVPDGITSVVEVRCLTPEGEERWATTLDGTTVDVPTSTPENVALVTYDDGRAVLAVSSPRTDAEDRHVLFVHYGSDGEETWRTAYAPPYTLFLAAPVDLKPLPDGGAVAAVTGFRVLRLSADGTVLWVADPGPSYWPAPEDPVDLVVASDGDFVVTGLSGESDAHALITARFAPDGTVRWTEYAAGTKLAAGTEGTTFEGWGCDSFSATARFADGPNGSAANARDSRLSVQAEGTVSKGSTGCGTYSVTARSPDGTMLWQAAYAPGDLDDSHIAALVPDGDGGVALVGSALRPASSLARTAAPSTVESVGGGVPRILVAVAFDAEGVVRWSVQREGTGAGDAFALAATPLAGNRLGIGGGASSAATTGPGPALVVLDADGTEVAASQTPAAPRPFSVVYGAGAVADGLVLFGERVGGDGTVGLHTVKIDGSGTVAWSRPVPGLVRQRYASRYDFHVTPDGGALVVGPAAENRYDVGVSRFEADGDVAWTSMYDGGSEDDPGSVVPDGSGGAYVSMWRRAPEGSPAVELAVVAFDANGDVRWTDGLPAVGTTGFHDPFAARFGDGVVVSGLALGGSLTRAYAFDGTLLWEHAGGGRPSDVHATPDGGACITILSETTDLRCIRPDGSLAWEANDLGDNGTGDHPSLIAVGADGAVTALVITDGRRSLRLLRYNSDGERLWAMPLTIAGRPNLTSAYPGSLTVDSDGHAYVAGAFYFGDDRTDAGYFLVGPEGDIRWEHIVRAREPGRVFGIEPRLDLGANEDLFIVAPQHSLFEAGLPYETPSFAFATVARFDRSSLPVVSESTGLPETEAWLSGAFPNPTDDVARFGLSLPAGFAEVTVAVYDVLGRRIAILHDGPLAPGEHDFSFDGTALPAGVYVVRTTGTDLDLARLITFVR